MSAAPALRGTGLAKRFGDTVALADVDLDLHRGESVAVMGPSGSGKSTLLHCLAGITRPDGGAVWLDGRRIDNLGERSRARLRRSQFGFVFQSGQLLPELPAAENVALPLMLEGRTRRRAVGPARGWLAALGLAGLEHRRPGELSGGQAQRVAIARALVADPAVVFADEPTAALDQATGLATVQLLVRVTAEAGAALLLVTHDPGVAALCTRTVHIRDGRLGTTPSSSTSPSTTSPPPATSRFATSATSSTPASPPTTSGLAMPATTPLPPRRTTSRFATSATSPTPATTSPSPGTPPTPTSSRFATAATSPTTPNSPTPATSPTSATTSPSPCSLPTPAASGVATFAATPTAPNSPTPATSPTAATTSPSPCSLPTPAASGVATFAATASQVGAPSSDLHDRHRAHTRDRAPDTTLGTGPGGSPLRPPAEPSRPADGSAAGCDARAERDPLAGQSWLTMSWGWPT